MFLDGDMAALAAYHSGDYSSSVVAQYFERFGLPGPRVSEFRAGPGMRRNIREPG
jgi:hypothetical protein